MRILFACYFELPHYGGLSRYVDTLKRELEEHGHQVDILSHHQGMQKIYKFSYRPNKFGWAVTGREIDKSTNCQEHTATIKDVIDHQVYQYYEQNLPHVDPRIRWREIERYTFEVAASLLDLSEYDLIHTHDILSTRALWRVKPADVPLVATVHGILATEYINSGEIKSKRSLMWKYALAEEYFGHMSTDATIVPTNWQKRQLRTKYTVPSRKINVIPYGMELYPFLKQLNFDPYPPLNHEQKSEGKFVIACPARLVPEKDHKTLMQALSILKETRKDFVCWLIGDGSLRFELELQAKQSGIRDHIVFFGARWDVPALLRMSDVVVLASIQDMHPFTLMEAQVAGKPCVASDAGGIPEVVRNGATGMIFQTGNSGQLARRLLKLMDNPQLRSQLAQDAMELGRVRYDSKTLYKKTMRIYQQVLNGRKSSTQFTVEEPDLSGQYGLTKARKLKENTISRLFGFDLDDSDFDFGKWRTIRKKCPTNYSIPDMAFIRVLAGGKQKARDWAKKG